MAHNVTVRLPEEIYRRLEQSAQASNTPVEELVVQSVKAGIPPLVNNLPDDYRKEFLELERLSDKELRRLAESTISAARERQYTNLLRKNQQGTLTKREQEHLKRLGAEARRLTLHKAYAYALLQWRGHRIPTPVELRQPQ